MYNRLGNGVKSVQGDILKFENRQKTSKMKQDILKFENAKYKQNEATCASD